MERDSQPLAERHRATERSGRRRASLLDTLVDEFTELTMRSVAQYTLGRYLFLTNDSGVGNSHKEPSIPCYFVTHLDRAILRMVDIELTGVYREPVVADILRTGGNPQSGACLLESGQSAVAY